MNKIREYEAWTQSGQLYDDEYGNQLENEVVELGVPRDIFIGLSNVPDSIDVESLAADIKTGALKEADYVSFCASNGLEANVKNNFSASKFLEFSYGRCIAWVHIPTDDGHELVEKIRTYLETKNIILLEA